MATAIKMTSNWREQLGAKLVTPEEAVAQIKSGDRITASIAHVTPFTLFHALAGRLMEIERVVINYSAALFAFDLPGLGERFRLESFYLSPIDRKLFHDGMGEYVPVSYYRAGHLPPGLQDFNVYLMTVSPPDANGEVNFGDFQIMSKLCARNADLVIAEIDSRSIRVGGDNSMHISEIDYFERTAGMPELAAPPPSEEERRTVENDRRPGRPRVDSRPRHHPGGVGSTSGMLMSHLHGHHDLGMQTEIIPIGTADLVREGVLTGKHKKIFPGLVVGSGFATGTPRAQLDYVDGNPAFQLYDFNFTDDIRTIAREDGLVSVNNALCVDLTGQVGSESVGHQMYTGTGGQIAFGVGASLAGGKSIIVLPASALSAGKRVSRITPSLPPATVFTLPRAFVHYVVTEYGVAKLAGKSLRERARELVAVAHPDFRGELSAEARRVYG